MTTALITCAILLFLYYNQVSFFITTKTRSARSLSTAKSSGFQVYYDLALASGGQAIQVTKASLPSATDIILDTSTSALVKKLIYVETGMH